MRVTVGEWHRCEASGDYISQCIVELKSHGVTYHGRAISKAEWSVEDKKRAVVKKARELFTEALYETHRELFPCA